MTRLIVVLAILGLGGLFAAESAHAQIQAPDPCKITHPALVEGDPERSMSLFLKARSSGADPYLSLDAEDSAEVVDFVAPNTGGTSGVSQSIAATSGERSGPIKFALEEGLPREVYFHLLRQVIGEFYWHTGANDAVAPATSGATEPIQFRIEILADGVRIGGKDYSHPGGATAGLQYLKFCFRPEIRMIPAQVPVEVMVTRISGYSELVIGTGDTRQSFVEFRYYDDDPLSSSLYIEDGNLLASQSGSTEDVPQGDASSVPGPMLGLAAMGFAFLRTRRMSFALAVIVAVTGFAGCLEEPSGGGIREVADASNAARPSVESRYTENKTLERIGRGGIVGRVLNPEGFPLDGAHVTGLGTNLYVKTDAKGRFSFDNVSVGTYHLRVDRDGFVSAEADVRVEPGKVLQLTFTLARPVEEIDNFKPHLHDDWEGHASKTIFSGDVETNWRLVQRDVKLQGVSSPGDTSLTSQARFQAPEGTDGERCITLATHCESEFFLPEGTVILPGTSQIRVTLDWEGADAPAEFALGYIVPSRGIHVTVARGPNDLHGIALYPTEADPGHTRQTDWRFIFRTLPVDGTHPYGETLSTLGSIGVTIELIRGVVPYEEAHADRWGGQDLLYLFNATEQSSLCVNCDYPDSTFGRWHMPPGKFVPQGTLEVRGELNWTITGPAQAATPWKLVYRSADLPVWGIEYPSVTEIRSEPGHLEFKIAPNENETDQVYQKQSRWALWVDDGDQPAKQLNTGYRTKWTLTLSVHRNPEWEPE